MRKKLILSICTLAMMLAFVACGSNEEVTYGGHTAEDFQASLVQYMSSLEALSEGDLDQYITYYETSDPLTYTALSDWKECMVVKGEFLSYTNFDIDKSGKTLTCTLTADYTARDLKLIFVFNANKIEQGPTAINVEPVYSLGETMQKAGLNTVMGIMIVFVMLVVMSLIISLFKLIPTIQAKFAKKEANEPVVEAPVAAPSVSAEENNLEIVAVIAAAIAASTGASTDSFVVRSIKKRR